MSSSPQAGIEGFITTHALSSCSMTWSESKGWLVIVGRGEAGISAARDRSLRPALARAVSGLGDPPGRETVHT